MSDILAEIILHKRREVAINRGMVSEQELLETCRLQSGDQRRDFVGALQSAVDLGNCGVIAELKRGSPSAGIIRDPYHPKSIAAEYAAAGASCLSVLTDERFFSGNFDHLQDARQSCQLPVLRKDFIIDEYQVLETAAMGADCMLLIAAVFGPRTAWLTALADSARQLGLQILLEVHDETELSTVLDADVPFDLLGINNRNLATLDVDLAVSETLFPLVPEHIPVVCESGISSQQDVQRISNCGIRRFLVGEILMRQQSPGQALKQIFSQDQIHNDNGAKHG